MSYVTNVPAIFRKKWFWIGFVLLLLFAIIWDLAVAATILVTSLKSGQWSATLLSLGLVYAFGIVYQMFLPHNQRRQIRWGGRLVLVTIAMLTLQEHGFLKMLYFMATVLIFARFTKWIVGFFIKRKKLKFAHH